MLTNEQSAWFNEHYLPVPELMQSYYVNPMLAPRDLLSQLPPVHLVSASLDPIQV